MPLERVQGVGVVRPVGRVMAAGGAAPVAYARDSYVSSTPVVASASTTLLGEVEAFFKRLFGAIAALFKGPASLPGAPVLPPTVPVAGPPSLPPGVPAPPPPPPPAPVPPPPPVAPPPPGAPTGQPTAGVHDAKGTDKKVFVHYMPWFDGGTRAKHWSFWGHDPSKLGADGLPDVAAAHHPLIGAYDTQDDAVLGYHLLLMKAGGFDGASMSWYGVGSQEDRVSQAIFDKANAWAGKYGFDFSLDLMPDADPYKGLSADEKVRRLTADVKAILARYAATPAYQRLGGKPILYFFPKPDPATGETTITPAMWAQVKANVGQPFDLVMESHNTAMNGVKDGDYGWIEKGNDPAQLNTAYLDWLYNSFAHDDPSQVVHMGVVYPGFDDVGVHAWTNDPNARRLIDRTMGGEATLQKTWDQLNAFNAAHPATPVSWVETATWNDWNEGSEIEPSVEEGDKELQLAARNNAAFKGTQAASPAAFQFPARYLALRHAGYSDDQLGAAIAAFCAGRYDQALSLLPAN